MKKYNTTQLMTTEFLSEIWIRMISENRLNDNFFNHNKIKKNKITDFISKKVMGQIISPMSEKCDSFKESSTPVEKKLINEAHKRILSEVYKQLGIISIHK